MNNTMELCPKCRTRKLNIFQINDKEAFLLCSDDQCNYPINGSNLDASNFILQRDISKILIDPNVFIKGKQIKQILINAERSKSRQETDIFKYYNRPQQISTNVDTINMPSGTFVVNDVSHPTAIDDELLMELISAIVSKPCTQADLDAIGHSTDDEQYLEIPVTLCPGLGYLMEFPADQLTALNGDTIYSTSQLPIEHRILPTEQEQILVEQEFNQLIEKKGNEPNVDFECHSNVTTELESIKQLLNKRKARFGKDNKSTVARSKRQTRRSYKKKNSIETVEKFTNKVLHSSTRETGTDADDASNDDITMQSQENDITIDECNRFGKTLFESLYSIKDVDLVANKLPFNDENVDVVNDCENGVLITQVHQNDADSTHILRNEQFQENAVNLISFSDNSNISKDGPMYEDTLSQRTVTTESETETQEIFTKRIRSCKKKELFAKSPNILDYEEAVSKLEKIKERIICALPTERDEITGKRKSLRSNDKENTRSRFSDMYSRVEEDDNSFYLEYEWKRSCNKCSATGTGPEKLVSSYVSIGFEIENSNWSPKNPTFTRCGCNFNPKHALVEELIYKSYPQLLMMFFENSIKKMDFRDWKLWQPTNVDKEFQYQLFACIYSSADNKYEFIYMDEDSKCWQSLNSDDNNRKLRSTNKDIQTVENIFNIRILIWRAISVLDSMSVQEDNSDLCDTSIHHCSNVTEEMKISSNYPDVIEETEISSHPSDVTEETKISRIQMSRCFQDSCKKRQSKGATVNKLFEGYVRRSSTGINPVSNSNDNYSSSLSTETVPTPSVTQTSEEDNSALNTIISKRLIGVAELSGRKASDLVKGNASRAESESDSFSSAKTAYYGGLEPIINSSDNEKVDYPPSIDSSITLTPYSEFPSSTLQSYATQDMMQHQQYFGVITPDILNQYDVFVPLDCQDETEAFVAALTSPNLFNF